MPWVPDVNPNELIESAWGNDIRDRVVNTFTNSAERAAAIPTPDPGMVTYLTASDALEFWNGTSWRQVGRGQLAYKILTVDQSGITTALADITGQAATLTLPPGRRIEINCSVTFHKGPPDTQADASLHLTDGTVSLTRSSDCHAPGFVAVAASIRASPPAGTVTWKAQARTGAGFLNVVAGARFWVDDIGPATMPE